MSDIIVKARNLNNYFIKNKSVFSLIDERVHIINDVNLDIVRGKTTSLVGESGSGKTTTAKILLNLIKLNSGTVEYNFKNFKTNYEGINKKYKSKFQKTVSFIFQDPFRSLSPRMNVKDIISEPLILNKYKRSDINKIIFNLIDKVGMPRNSLNRYPHEFSGGQRQRISIARSLALNPEFIVADEPVSALDVSIQAQILNLLIELQREYNLTYLFISHDLRIVASISDYVNVMYAGNIVEYGEALSIFKNPHHPYTEALIKSIPNSEPVSDKDYILEGEAVDITNKPPGCVFNPRCRYKKDICQQDIPKYKEDKRIKSGYRCHFDKNSFERGPPI